MTGLVSRLLAPGLFGAEIWDEGQAITVHPDENIHVVGSAEKRRRDFALGRACARAAMAGLGQGETVIVKGEDGAPLWPPGIVGSITHTQGYAAALVGETGDFAGIGIDAERIGGVTRELWPRIFTSSEQDRLRSQPEPLLAATLLFSAKEASYKAWALKGAPAFREIEIAQDDDGFVAARSDVRLRGRYAMERGLVLVAAWRER